MKVGIGKVIGWAIVSIGFLALFVLMTLMGENRLVVLTGAALVMCISATYIQYKNYKGQKEKEKDKK